MTLALPPEDSMPTAASRSALADPELVELARAGNMIAAIKEYRSATGAGLAEAKQAIEAIR